MRDVFDPVYQQAQGRGANAAAAPGFIRQNGAAAEAFYDDQILLFQKRTALFLRRSFPAYAKSLTEAELEKLALNVQKRAAAAGFTTENHIWHYLIAIVYCGFFFEQDGQYADMLALIGWHEEASDKALLLDRLLDIVDEYVLECEKDFADFGKKMRYLAEFYASPRFGRAALDALPPAEHIALGEHLLQAIFPVRAELWTAENRGKIIAQSLDHAHRIGFDVKDGLFYLLASVYFGRAFEQSPLYPWAYFLQNRNIPAPERGKHFIALARKHFQQLAG